MYNAAYFTRRHIKLPGSTSSLMQATRLLFPSKLNYSCCNPVSVEKQASSAIVHQRILAAKSPIILYKGCKITFKQSMPYCCRWGFWRWTRVVHSLRWISLGPYRLGFRFCAWVWENLNQVLGTSSYSLGIGAIFSAPLTRGGLAENRRNLGIIW